jgi:protein phosphatase
MSNNQPFVWSSSGMTHVGHVRAVNEDAFLDRSDIQLWAVADGMGGHHAGEIASDTVVSELNQISSIPKRLSTYVNDIEDSIISANQQLRKLAAEHNDQRTIGSTVMTLVAHQKYCAFLWAGDSRIYRARNGDCEIMTRDHSQVEEMIERGILNREDANSHPASNVITRAVGASNDLYVDVDIDEVEHGDTFVICSDGLYRHLSDQDIGDQINDGNISNICQTLIDLTLERGAMDNVTVVVVRAEASK